MIHKIIIGLGNPEKKYSLTRHNIGFLAIDAYSKIKEMDFSRKTCSSVIAKKVINEKTIILAKPQTYMNLSGKAVKELSSYFPVSLENILVICDDVNLSFGRIRFRSNGRHGGHNGLLSIIENLNTDQFPRLRVGVGSPDKNLDMKSYVLMNFTSLEHKNLDEKILPTIIDAINTFVENNIHAAMNKFNGTNLIEE